MIKKNITIGDFHKIELTGQFNHLRAWWNFLPTVLIAKKTAKYIESVINQINDKNKPELDKAILKHKFKKETEITLLQACEKIIINNLNTKARLLIIKNRIAVNRQLRRKLAKIDIKSDIFNFAKMKIEEVTGIAIEGIDDVIRFQDLLRIKEEKYNEFLISQKGDEPEGASNEKAYLIDYAIGVLLYISADVTKVENMRISTFLTLRRSAIKRMNAENDNLKKMKQHGKQ